MSTPFLIIDSDISEEGLKKLQKSEKTLSNFIPSLFYLPQGQKSSLHCPFKEAMDAFMKQAEKKEKEELRAKLQQLLDNSNMSKVKQRRLCLQSCSIFLLPESTI
jgi:hypothetical protein